MPTIEEIQDETVRANKTEKDDDEWDDEESNISVSRHIYTFILLMICWRLLFLIQSNYSSDDEDEVLERGLVVPQESIWERISALKDIIPPSTRQSLFAKASKVSSYGSIGLLIGGKLAWVFTTTALLVGLPYALAVEDEMRITQQERDMMSQQQGALAVSWRSLKLTRSFCSHFIFLSYRWLDQISKEDNNLNQGHKAFVHLGSKRHIKFKYCHVPCVLLHQLIFPPLFFSIQSSGVKSFRVQDHVHCRL